MPMPLYSGVARTSLRRRASARPVAVPTLHGISLCLPCALCSLTHHFPSPFADSSYSANYTQPGSDGIRKMFACRVAAGAVIQGLKDQRVPGEIGHWEGNRWVVTDQQVRDKAAELLFDTGVGVDASDPDRWITYNDHQAYPEYIVSFR